MMNWPVIRDPRTLHRGMLVSLVRRIALFILLDGLPLGVSTLGVLLFQLS